MQTRIKNDELQILLEEYLGKGRGCLKHEDYCKEVGSGKKLDLKKLLTDKDYLPYLSDVSLIEYNADLIDFTDVTIIQVKVNKYASKTLLNTHGFYRPGVKGAKEAAKPISPYSHLVQQPIDGMFKNG